MRRMILLVGIVVAPLTLGAGVARAARIDRDTDPAADYFNARIGTADDRVEGENGDDTILGGEGGDWLEGNAGNDTLAADQGNDVFLGGGHDIIYSGGDPGFSDIINCGPGKKDVVSFDQGVDMVSKNWERRVPRT